MATTHPQPHLPASILTPKPTISQFPDNPKTLILKQCKTLNDLKQVHAHLLKTGRHLDPSITENLLESAALLLPNTMDYALSIFDKIENPGAGAYNIMMRAFTLKKSPEKALSLFRKMVEHGVPFDDFTFPSVLKACSWLRAIEEGKQIHTQILKCGFGCKSFVLSSLIHYYAICGDVKIARKLFDGLPERDLFTWNSMLSGYVRNGCFKDAVRLFREMRELNVGFSDITLISVLTACGRLADIELGEWIAEYVRGNGLEKNVNLVTAVVDMYAKCGNVDKARSLFDQMDRRDVISWTAMISGYSQVKRCKEALDLFKDMQMANLDANEVTMVSVLSCCADLGSLETGKWVHMYIKKKRLKLTVTLGTALIDFYAKCGSIDDAIEVFQNMPLKNVYSWTALIQGLVHNGQGKRALDFFQLMQERNVKPDEVTFTGVLSACSQLGLVDEGRQCFASMSKDFGIEPRWEHYVCMVDILGRAGLIDDAYELIKSMPFQPNAVIWGTLLASCRVHKNVEVGERSLKHLISLKPTHSADFILLSNIFASMGRTEDAERIRSQMKEKGIMKTPGCSSIELEGVIHEFLAEKNTHLQEGIYKTTEDIMERIKSAGYVPNISDEILDADEDDKESALSYHSEKLAISFGLINTPAGTTIRISSNDRVCTDCHNAAKVISKVYNRCIVLKDRNRVHHFEGGSCSCNDYW